MSWTLWGLTLPSGYKLCNTGICCKDLMYLEGLVTYLSYSSSIVIHSEMWLPVAPILTFVEPAIHLLKAHDPKVIKFFQIAEASDSNNPFSIAPVLNRSQ